MKRRDSLTLERLKQVVRYEPDTGLFYWVSRPSNRIHVGDRAGLAAPVGYWSIAIDGARYLAHRLAWLYVTGHWPKDEVDHLNGDGTDNRWSNLREAHRVLNAQNMRRAKRDNSTGYLGVREMRSRFQANIKAGGRIQNLGTYDTPEQAHAAYLVAKRRLHEGNTL